MNETEKPVPEESVEVPSNLKDQIALLMQYLEKIKDNGELAIFAALFQLDFQMISYLHAHPAAHPSEMASALRVTRPNIAANLRLLEEKEYLVRMVDQENRRQVYVNLTRKGEQYYELCLQQLEYLFAGWFSMLGGEEVKHLFNILAKSSDPSVMSDALKNFSFGK